jgi:ferritin-like metal-binding protein YciE
MQVLTILTALRIELDQAERAATHAWEHYAQAMSDETLSQAIEATRRIITVHQQLANRLEQVVGASARESKKPQATLMERLTPPAA